MRKIVGIQGIQGSFHDVVARSYFGKDVSVVECPSFRNLCHMLENHTADYCVMAIENSIAGSLLTNYTLLEEFDFKIVGEYYQRIEHSLMALAGQSLTEIELVQSHPMAILQCQDFLFHQMAQAKVQETSDTAESAKNISAGNLKKVAAIAHEQAARMYGLEVLKKGIESDQKNYTRFLIVCRSEDYAPAEQANKTSIRFEVSHEPGSLGRALSLLSDQKMNLTKIQSVPILGRPYEYSMHIDLNWPSVCNYREALSQLAKQSKKMVNFGFYKQADWEKND